MITHANLYKLRSEIEDRLVAKAERLGTHPIAIFRAGGWAERAFHELDEARHEESRGNAKMARFFVRSALESLARANRRARGFYGEIAS